MRTKTLLVTVAALAAGLFTSQAAVTSANIVGYANVATAQANVNYLVAVPFKVGVSNGANEVWPLVGGNPSIPDSSQILIWNGSGYTTYLSDSSSPSLWDDGDGNPLNSAPILPVGQGFFLNPFAPTTNVFAGAIAINVGTSNKMTFPSANVNYLVSPVVPYGGAVTNGDPVTGVGGPGLSSNNGLPDSSQLLLWTGSSYTTYLSDSSSPSLWDDGDGNPLPTPPTISVGQGFFINPFSPFTWTVGL